MKVRDVFSLSGLKYSYIQAGSDGLDNKINTVTVLEVAETQGQSWLIEGQLYITSLYAVMNDVEKQLQIFEALIKAKSAGVIICHIDLWLKQIDEKIIELCEKNDFPLIVAKSETTYIEIMNPIILKLMTDPSNNHIDTNEMQNKLIEYVANKKDIGVIYKTMAEYYKKDIYFLNVDRKLVYPKYSRNFEDLKDYIYDKFKLSINSTYVFENKLEIRNKYYLIKSVESERINFGIIIAEIDPLNNDYDSQLLAIIARIFTLIVTKKSRVSELESRKKEEYLSDLITWNFRSNEVAYKVGLELNWDITDINQIIIVNMNTYQEKTGENLRELKKHIENVQYKEVKNIIKCQNKNNLIGIRSDLIIILLSKDKANVPDKARIICEDILRLWDVELSGNISIGVSDKFDNPNDIPKGYLQSMDAMKFSRNYFGDNLYFEYRHLGVYSILSNIKKNKDLEKSLKDIFIKIEDYDNKNKQDLYNTLKYLILNDMNIEKVASIMFIHKNTVLYRKNKIVDILGYEPWKMPYLLNSIVRFSI